jgi:NADH-ubiquinone/plastoquinone oxidoreductase, chain 3
MNSLKKKLEFILNTLIAFMRQASSFCFDNFKRIGLFPSSFAINIFHTQFSTLEKQEYFKIFNLFIIIFALSLLLFIVAYFLSLSTIKDSEKLSQYECGFEPFDEATRHPFDVHFYIVGILFLIFDVEIALLFP